MNRFKFVLMNDEPGEAGGGAPVAEAPAEGGNWYDSLPQEMREDQNITKFDSVETMAKSWQNAQRLIGADKIPMPQTDDDWSNTYARLGRPEEAAAYEISAPEGFEIDEQAQGAFKDIAHSVGLNQQQMSKLTAWYFSDQQARGEAQAGATEAATNEQIAALKAEWGNAFEQNVQIANRAVTEFASEADVKFLQENTVNGVKLADHPVLARMFGNIGKSMMESGKLEGVGSEQAKTPQEIEDERNSLMAHPAYMDKRHPEHQQIMRRVQDSFKLQYG